MIAVSIIAVALGGAAGSITRALIETAVRRRFGHGFPWWGFIINTSGAFALGLLLGYAEQHRVPAVVLAGIGTGFIGAYTMLAPINVDGPRLAVNGRPTHAAVVTLGGYALALGAAMLGLGIVGGL